MIITALTTWNRHIPKQDMRVVQPGDILHVEPEGLAKWMIKEGWAKA